MRRTTVAAALTVLAVLALVPHTSAGEEVEQLLPNLRPRPPVDMYIERDGSGMRWLRFGTEIANNGRGPLELEPVDPAAPCEADEQLALQHLFEDSIDNGEFDRGTEQEPGDTYTSREAGCSVFHPSHNHWHFENFARYELFRIRSNGTLRRVAVSVADKVSFCMTDTGPLRVKPPGTPSERYYKAISQGGCGQNDESGQNEESGISIGWYDLYSSSTPGQQLPLRGVKNGLYCLSYVIDPANLLTEADDGDNARMKRLRIAGGEVTTPRPWKRCPSL